MGDRSQILTNILISSGLAGLGYLTYKLFKYLRQESSNYQEILNTQVITLDQLSKATKKQNLIVKGLVNVSPKLITKRNITSNQLYYCQPSRIPIIKQYSIMMIFNNAQWSIKDKKGQIYKVKGVGQILNPNIISLKTKYQDFEIGFFSKLYKNITYILEAIPDFFRTTYGKASNSHRTPVFLGPQVGQLICQTFIMMNTMIVLKCSLDEDGKIVPQLIGCSKLDILQQLQRQLNTYFLLQILLAIGFTLLTYHSLKYMVKKFFSIPKSDNKQLFNLRIDQQGSNCIVCFNKWKNTLLMNCKHMNQCDQCWGERKSNLCPICKQQVTHAKYIYKD